MLETFICSRCGREHPIADRVLFGGQELCPACREASTYVCSRCGERIWRDSNYGTSSMPLCETCEEQYYERCCNCGRLVERGDLRCLPYDDEDEDDNGYCEECYARCLQNSNIWNYSYKSEPIFYGDGYRYLGVELEVDGGGESCRNATRIQAVGNDILDHIYIKHDGSLDAGLEIVTHPMTLDYHQREMPWQKVLSEAKRLGYTSHQAQTCGLHVHVNRSSLGGDRKEQEDTIARILFLVETFWNEFLRFSRRTQKQIDKWASRYGRKDEPKAVLQSAKCRGDRYTCVNLTPRYTIEFRMFRGTLKYNTLIATLQMVEFICGVALSLSDEEIKSLTWSGFVSNIEEEDMPELILYLKERRLYVNEPVTASEEV